MKPTHLARPPIREAVFDIRTEGPPDVEALRVAAAQFGQEAGMVRTDPIRAGVIEMAFGPEAPITGQARDTSIIGYRVADEPTSRIVQFRNNGFTYSLVGNYDTWERFRDEAIGPARRFLQLPGVGRVTRLALRYINVIQFPSEQVNLEQYLPAAPRVPPDLPQVVAGFLSRVVVPIPDEGLTAIVTQALDESARPTPSVILDIDVFSQGLWPAQEEALLPVLETIRTWKNRIFFAFVNENTVSLHT